MTDIKIRVFNFTTNNKNYEIFNSQMIKIVKANESYYIYNFDKHSDTLRYFYSNIYFNSQILKKIDTKELVVDGKAVSISKYYYEDKKNYKADRYIFTNNEDGIIFIESLNSGNMTEFNIKNFRKIHKAIALKELNFKDGPFELKYANRNYKEFLDSLPDHINTDKGK
ncbi:hypothetical protein NU08_1269 [Flavobacterium anhuiense]|uniref:Uncharacterized protein n=2 Tax=Flavobacterium anhuiense TaxID=459526 RepID=A0A444W122_9FLAO|nr:hypothetical protein NU08_1269 [Flavobacterium anhuiense]